MRRIKILLIILGLVGSFALGRSIQKQKNNMVIRRLWGIENKIDDLEYRIEELENTMNELEWEIRKIKYKINE